MEVKSIVVAIISVAAASLPIIVAYVLPRWPKGTKQVKIAQAEEELAKPKEQETANRNKLACNRFSRFQEVNHHALKDAACEQTPF